MSYKNKTERLNITDTTTTWGKCVYFCMYMYVFIGYIFLVDISKL